MSSSTCLTLWPLKTCGMHASCVEDENATSASCICDKGWKQTTEFQYFADEPSKGLCYHNDDIVLFLYYVTGIITFIALTGQISVIRNRRQLIRLTPSILSLLFSFSAAVLRINLPDKALFGEDLAFTFLVSNGIAMILVAIKMFLLKYTAYVLQRHNAPNRSISPALIRAQRFTYVQKKVMICDAISIQLFWVLCFVNRRVKLLLFRTSLAVSLVQVLYILYFSQTFLGEYVNDLNTVLIADKLRFSKTAQEPMGKHNRDMFITRWVTKQHRKAKQFRKSALYFGLFGTFYFGFALFFDFAVAGWTYLLPVSYILWSFLVLNAIYFAILKRIKPKGSERFYKSSENSDKSEDFIGKSFEQTIMPKRTLNDSILQLRDIKTVKSMRETASESTSSESSDVLI